MCGYGNYEIIIITRSIVFLHVREPILTAGKQMVVDKRIHNYYNAVEERLTLLLGNVSTSGFAVVYKRVMRINMCLCIAENGRFLVK